MRVPAVFLLVSSAFFYFPVAAEGPFDEHCETSACPSFGKIEAFNSQIVDDLNLLLSFKYFRYAKVNMFKGCPFWQQDFYCVQKDCAVETIDDESEIPLDWKAKALSAVDFSPANGLGFSSFSNKCEYKEKDYCLVDDDSSADAKYIDLAKNPERFTGYSGTSTAQVWGAIYKENCFPFVGKPVWGDISNEDVCMEKKGCMPQSQPISVCRTSTELPYSDLNCFRFRVGNFPDRVKNLYFTYGVVLKALQKAAKYLKNYSYCATESATDDTVKLEETLAKVLGGIKKFDNVLDTTKLFTADDAIQLKEEFKERFRNISRIMDCVACEKCRLWGKIQTSGLGTALKILFSYRDGTKDYQLTRMEVLSLLNAFGRLSNSIKGKVMFDEMALQEAQKSAEQTQGSGPFDPLAMFKHGFDDLVKLSKKSVDLWKQNKEKHGNYHNLLLLVIVALTLARVFYATRNVAQVKKAIKQRKQQKKNN